MGTDVLHIPKPADDKKDSFVPAPSPHSLRPTSCPPQTPPLVDPTTVRNARVTPNLRDMMHSSWTPGLQDANPPMPDMFASPDPTAMYNFLALPSPSPLLRDFYHTQSPMVGMVPPYLNADRAEAQRAEKLAGVCEEMNSLFENLPQQEAENRSDNGPDSGGPGSNMSSQDLDQSDKETRNRSDNEPSQARTWATTTAPSMQQSRYQTSQSSYETPPLLETSSISPSCSPQLAESRVQKWKTKKRKSQDTTAHIGTKKSSNKPDKLKRPSTRPPPVQATSQPQFSHQMPMNPAASAMAAANAFVMNPAFAGLMPFQGGIPPGVHPQMFPGATPMLYQGRPVAFVPGARGPELVSVDMFAQASAMQYGAAQALQAANRMSNPVPTHTPAPSPSFPDDRASGSRKKRRRQMLERSGCSEEQARENRARALKRLRQKKTLRNQQSTVRYACRKRIAMVRPRVNGRFATKEEVEQSQQEALVGK